MLHPREARSSHPWPSDRANNAAAVGRPIVVAESLRFNDASTDSILNDPSAVDNVSIVAGHFYGGGNRVHQNALDHGKRIWQTEHFINGTDDLGTAMSVAKEISDAMNNQFSAYFWRWISPGSDSTFINGTTVDTRGYVMGQFAHWVRPGMVRCSTTCNPQPNIYVTAYHNDDNDDLVVVALNTSTSYVPQTFVLQ